MAPPDSAQLGTGHVLSPQYRASLIEPPPKRGVSLPSGEEWVINLTKEALIVGYKAIQRLANAIPPHHDAGHPVTRDGHAHPPRLGRKSGGAVHVRRADAAR